MNGISAGHRTARTLVIACGALAREIVALKRANHWHHLTISCLPADLHNRPEKIPAAVRSKLEKATSGFDKVFVAYADCGTGGRLDAVLENAEPSVERLPGAHCYEFFAGPRVFNELSEAEPGTFYLTDFLARHFDRLIVKGLGLDRHPELTEAYFGNYRKVVYLSQTSDPALAARAKAAAERLGLDFEQRQTGYGELETGLRAVAGVAVGFSSAGLSAQRSM